jgi:N-acetylmuramoyl-L-alanine amidase
MKTIGLAILATLLFCSQSLSETCDYERQIEVLALNMYHEARGEGPDGMQMVGEVTLTRVEHEAFPNSICAVVYQRRQFSWTHMRKNHTPNDEELWNVALEMAENLINGEIDYFDNGATHFLNPNAVKSMPRWARTFDKVGRVGNHVFYEM